MSWPVRDFSRRIVGRFFSSMSPRLFHFIRLLPGVGDAMLWAIDATSSPHALLLKRIRAGPLSGMTLEVDPRALDMVIGRYEPAIQAVLESTLRKGGVAFDIGANLGYFTLVMAKQVGPGGRVVSFEPDPEMFSALTRNIERNIDDAKGIVAVPGAVGAEAGTVRFARGWRSTRGKIVSSGGDLEVELMKVDDAADRFGVPRLLKIDVEGAELDVLRGAGAILKSEKPLVLVEVHSDELERSCARLLEEFGYECARRVDLGKREPYLVATSPIS
jgi:FkbM family methyltransferase